MKQKLGAEKRKAEICEGLKGATNQSFLIRNEEITASFRNYFDFLWKKAKP